MRALLALLALLAALAVAVALWPTGDPSPLRPDRGLARKVAPPAPGSPLSVVLGEPPAARYADPTPRRDPWVDETLDALGLDREPTLDRAARELARIYAAQRSLLPGDALQFLLDSAGAVLWGVRQTVVITDEPAPTAVADALRPQVSEAGARAGVGRAPLPDGRTVVALVSGQANLRLDPANRAPPSGAPLALTGSVAPSIGPLHALALDPQGRFSDLPLDRDGQRFTLTWTPTPGDWVVEILGEGRHGPAPLAQLTFHVDGELPTALHTRWPADPDPVDAAAAAALIARDRAAAGLPPLRRLAALDAVAAAHARDMRDNGFMGHVSPTTGRPADRVRAAGYRAAIVAENVAFNRSLTDAQAGLMRSLGHRRNLLSHDLTALGVGLAADRDGWYIAQVFARPRPVVADPEAAAGALLDRLTGACGRALRRSSRLDRLALAEAQRPHPTPQRVLDAAAKDGVTGKVTAWVATLALLEQFEPPDELKAGACEAVGIGVHQRSGGDGPDIQVVMLLAD